MAETKKKAKAVLIVSPRGIAAYAWLNKPDTRFNNPGKYEVTLKLLKGETKAEEFVKMLNKVAKEFGKNKPVEDGDKKEKEDFHGFWLVKFKSKYKPHMVDTNKVTLPESVIIWPGDVIKVAFKMEGYDGMGGGIGKQIGSVMLLEKNSAGKASAELFEDDEEGYTAEEAEYAADEDTDTADAGNGDF